MNVARIEYNQGVTKKYFRSTNNHTTKTVGTYVKVSLAMVTLDTVTKQPIMHNHI